ncbi:Short-chain dehydrogenase [Faunimonas pinastri]|uniref:Short-chain dehydrogenase n=1 Tax=Faunimonas pinastri TaxID=1855383 RepID=A0A1H9P2B9_9HYPH|nr:SDR family NAD(P)-dependent oxidoreductase [Faunimonas pinastri]SER42340.1 Short-chain dehydrogenase [Faunimonas pinastri]
MTDPKTILITGCSSGIGEACATGMKARGWRVFATARNAADLARLTEAGLEALYLDYREPDSIGAAFEAVMEATGGRLDALVNNGAYAQPGALEDLSLAALREQFETNFFGWHELTRLAIPVMRRQGSGRIVMVSSILGLFAMGFRGAYSTTKFAIEAYCDTLRIELAGSGIQVSAIEPGPIASRIGQNSILAFHRHIDPETSVHRSYYRRRLKGLESGGNTRGQLGPEAVLKVLVHAAEARHPRPQYFVTYPTHLMGALRRLLPKRVLDRSAIRSSRNS